MTRKILLMILLTAAAFAGGYFFDRANRSITVAFDCTGIRT